MIWLVRHTEAEDGTPDEDRRLTEKGEEDARAIGVALTRVGAEVAACVSSPKVRARETARLLCESLGIDVIQDERLAGGPFDAHELAGEHGENVMLVGHDPDFSLAVHRMTGAQVRLQKGSVVGIDRGELKLLLRPEELRALAQGG